MTIFENVKSVVCPEAIVFDEVSVWINSDIKEVEANIGGEVFVEYKFNQKRYSKDEFIRLLRDKNLELEAQLTDTQLALCEIYEGMM